MHLFIAQVIKTDGIFNRALTKWEKQGFFFWGGGLHKTRTFSIFYSRWCLLVVHLLLFLVLSWMTRQMNFPVLGVKLKWKSQSRVKRPYLPLRFVLPFPVASMLIVSYFVQPRSRAFTRLLLQLHCRVFALHWKLTSPWLPLILLTHLFTFKPSPQSPPISFFSYPSHPRDPGVKLHWRGHPAPLQTSPNGSSSPMGHARRPLPVP